MKVFILGVFCGLLVACNAAPAKLDEVKPIAIVRSASENNADGSYSYSFESEDGTKMEESGSQKQVGPSLKISAPFPADLTPSPLPMASS